MSVRLVATTAELLNENIFRLELLNALRKTATAIKRDFDSTIRTWDEKPEFVEKIELKRNYDLMAVNVVTDSEKYKWVDEGTAPHVIRPVGGGVLAFPANYESKTTPNVIGSKPGGSSGEMIFAREVHHPGIEARNFSKIIAEKHRETMVKNTEEAIARAIAKAVK